MKLSIYLIDDQVQAFQDAILENKLEPEGDFAQVSVTDCPFEAQAYVQTNRTTPPKWLDFFAPHLALPTQTPILNSSNSLLLLLKTNGHTFAISQGYGFVLLRRQAIVRDFGLRTTLNAIDPAKIRCLDWRNIDTLTRQVRTLFNTECELSEFDIDAQQDLLRYACGTPAAGMGTRMEGSDSLSWTVDIDFAEIADRCVEIHELYSADTYQEHFAFIDNMQRVTDPTTIADLDSQLYSALENSQTTKLSVAYPELLRWDVISRFRISGSHRHLHTREIDLEALFGFLEENPTVSRDPHRIRILALDDEDRPVSPQTDLYEYLVFETAYSGSTYILSIGTWFRVSEDYIHRVEQAVTTIPQITGLPLPRIQRGEWEDHYNERAAQASNGALLLLHKDNVPITGPSRIEVCDLLSPDWNFIHVKRENYSATLSHLFSQGSVSAELLASLRPYREHILSAIPHNWPTPPFTADDSGEHSQMTVVYAISSSAPGPLAQDLPFFSKVNLLQHCASLQRMGFRYAIHQIEYQ